MMKKNSIFLLLALCMLLSVFAGCQAAPAKSTAPETTLAPTESVYVFTEEDRMAALQEYLMLTSSGSAGETLHYLGLYDFTDYPISEDYYMISDIPYDTFYQMMMERMTPKLFEENFSFRFRENNGNLEFFAGGESGQNITVVSIVPKDDGLAYYAELRYVNFDDSEDTVYMTFTCDEADGHCVISSVEW